MTETALSSLLDLLRSWFGNEELREEHNGDLEAYLASAGLDDITAGEAYDVVGLYCDTLPIQSQSGDFSRNYRTSATSEGGNQRVEAPPPPKHDDDWDAVNNYTEYVVNTYNYTEITDQSVNTQIQAGGDVDFDQEVDNVSADDGGVALGEDADIDDSNVVTGDDNLVAEDSNVATGGSQAGTRDSQNVGGDGIAQQASTAENIGFGEGDVSQDNDQVTVIGSTNVNTATGEGDADQDVDQSVDQEWDYESETNYEVHSETSYEQDTEIHQEIHDGDAEADTDQEIEDEGFEPV